MAIDRTRAGRRVEFHHSSDPYTRLKKGDLGTIKYEIDNEDCWSVCIDWDNGSSLSMLPLEGDSFGEVKDANV